MAVICKTQSDSKPMNAAATALKQYFGYDTFRPLQAEIIEAVLAKKDVFVLMPTGGGKSICFQIPALVQDGVCVVVSPLIALMKDQVEALQANGISAAYLNSSQTTAEQRNVEADMSAGKLKLLYISPEKLVSNYTITWLKKFTINLFAIDEAHCISSWGHDFRPEYTQLRTLKESFPQVPILALTATADKVTRKDILEQLNLQNPTVFVASFDRPNLSLTVKPAQDRFGIVHYFIKARPNQSGIVYCLSRKGTENLAEKLQAKGIKAKAYHAGMDAKARAAVQEEFINDETPIICATIAFGMGIDKSNVRWVIHYNMPKNMEGYYQEIGRAGRDGLPSDTLLLYGLDDLIMLREFAQQSGQAEIQLEKLGRMRQYAEAKICRRKILLSYFGDILEQDCGNCDVCKNPPKYFDGTVAIQKALSALLRTEEKVGSALLIDILRGARTQELLEKGYDSIKTYGVGREFSVFEWQQIILQAVQLGIVEIAYDDHKHLKVTTFGKDILQQKRNVPLVQLEKFNAETRKKTAEQTPKEKPVSEAELLTQELFELLKEKRKRVAEELKIPPYVVFSDATLQEMAQKKPLLVSAMQNISGVGEAKMEKFGKGFLGVIVKFTIEKAKQGAKITGSTYLLTYDLYQQGKPLEEIAMTRNLNIGTIGQHLAYLYENGYKINFDDLVSPQEFQRVVDVYLALNKPEAAKPIFEALNGEIGYEKIRLAVAKYKLM
jgi:ATP-dependent DNA helicase RecQ